MARPVLRIGERWAQLSFCSGGRTGPYLVLGALFIACRCSGMLRRQEPTTCKSGLAPLGDGLKSAVSHWRTTSYVQLHLLQARYSPPTAPVAPQCVHGVLPAIYRCVSHEGRPTWETHRIHTGHPRGNHATNTVGASWFWPRFQELALLSSWNSPRSRGRDGVPDWGPGPKGLGRLPKGWIVSHLCKRLSLSDLGPI
jgi:hypothetical protein